MPTISDYILKQEEPNQSCLMALNDIIGSFHEAFDSTVKYGLPCYCINKKPVVYLNIEKKTNVPYLLFVDGDLLDNPMLDRGDRKKMKILKVDANQDLPIELIEEILNETIQLRTRKNKS